MDIAKLTEGGKLFTAVPTSPCPDVFTYRKDLRTNQIFGHIKISNLQIGQIATLDINLLPAPHQATIVPLKTLEESLNDISHGLPINYRVNFSPLLPPPRILSIQLNDKIICAAHHSRKLSTVINLNKTSFPRRPQRQWKLVTQTIRPQFVQPIRVAPVSQSNFDCGKPSDAFLSQSSNNELPWIVPLFDRINPQHLRYICSSMIITKNHLITAAHCVYENNGYIPSERIVATPRTYRINIISADNVRFAAIEAVIPNEEYDAADELNDANVAVLRLSEALIFSDHIIPICLWQGDNDLSRIVGLEGFVMGWGSFPSVGSHFNTTIVNRQLCNFNLAKAYPENARIFCGEVVDRTSCVGDSGSGLVLRSGDQYFLRGIVSRGQIDHLTLECDDIRFVQYTDIAPFRYWLKKVTN
ncbi:CLIP domain-containing serine protease B15-like isoform X2 [Toxorhynchites rutilus septentrionalis]|uniref:CLIP domain-containing serine protease B15-like isoform X2 n=1 Tax=Toxorhynchites rutilus septentrionalis TaxID=329112 RepID=UPI0024790417|nr:CLIP domain-containing serine protease B15-like isoform X2 [Toxorhynchites rutilus septentrionalis]